MKPKKGLNLLKKYLSGKPSHEEQIQVDKWYDSISENTEEIESVDQIKEEIYQSTWNRLNQSPRSVPLYKKPFFRYSIAAALIICLGATWFLIQQKNPPLTQPLVQAAGPKNDVDPPTDSRAILELADGRIIVLDSAGSGSLATQGQAVITKLSADKIAYTPIENESGTPSFNTLRVPKGSKPVQLQLADGSLVWLNVGSSITYPSHFVGNTREVKMTGEAYFEISSNAARPFIVQKGEMSVRVLGTHFNINAYEDEAASKITLLEGSVEVNRTANERLLIKPGQQAVVGSGAGIKLAKSVDLEEVMAWKNGWFYFNRLSLPEIMRQLEKWYDVDVTYEGTKSTKNFTGMVDRNNPLSEVVKLMEMAGIKFRISGKKIHVMQ